MPRSGLGIVCLACCLLGSSAVHSLAQDLFELEVFEYQSGAPGEYEVEFHSNGMTRNSVFGDTRAAGGRHAGHRDEPRPGTAVTDYFSAAATTRRFLPQLNAHHLMFVGIDLDVAPGWELGVSAGHCLTRSGEPWLMKSVIGYSF